METHVGTSGYSYKEWKGSFYPAGMQAGDMLGHYAGQFTSVEINNTFYKTPAIEALENWAAQVPSHFRFAVKANQRITHMKRLKDPEQSLPLFLERLTALGPRLGPVLFQLPPNFKKDLPRLQDFLAFLGSCRIGRRKVQAAFEFRHPAWFADDVFAVLEKAGVALCHADGEVADAPLVSTAPFGYVRLRNLELDKRALRQWHKRIHKLAADSDWKKLYVYFKHEDEGIGPRLAQDFLKLKSPK